MTSSAPVLLAGFIAFIKLQPASRELNHKYWYSCAVGDYISTVDYREDIEVMLEEVSDKRGRTISSEEIVSVVGKGTLLLEVQSLHFANLVLEPSNPDLYSELNHKWNNKFQTYGDLANAV